MGQLARDQADVTVRTRLCTTRYVGGAVECVSKDAVGRCVRGRQDGKFVYFQAILSIGYFQRVYTCRQAGGRRLLHPVPTTARVVVHGLPAAAVDAIEPGIIVGAGVGVDAEEDVEAAGTRAKRIGCPVDAGCDVGGVADTRYVSRARITGTARVARAVAALASIWALRFEICAIVVTARFQKIDTLGLNDVISEHRHLHGAYATPRDGCCTCVPLAVYHDFVVPGLEIHGPEPPERQPAAGVPRDRLIDVVG